MHARSSLAFVLSVTLAALVAAPAQAQTQSRYKWRDSAGQMHYSDTLTREAISVGYEIVNNQGVTTKRVARPLTADERVLASKAAVQAKADREAAELQARNDRQLLATYPTEIELVTAQRLQLDQLEQIVRSAHFGLQTQEATLADLLGRADELQHRGSPVPKKLNDQITELRGQLEQQRAYQTVKQRERDNAASAQAAQLAHYRKLQAAIAARP